MNNKQGAFKCCYFTGDIFQGSSEAERATVNRRVEISKFSLGARG